MNHQEHEDVVNHEGHEGRCPSWLKIFVFFVVEVR